MSATILASPAAPARTSAHARRRGGLAALACATFVCGLAEYVVSGLLPNVAHDLKISAGTAGLLVTTYAVGIIVGALVVTTALSRVSPKSALLWLTACFTTGNVLCALGPGFGLVLVGRVVAGVANGGFLGIGLVVAVSLVEESRRGRAVAVMLTGLTLANVLGVPLGTLVGQHSSWRVTFGVVAGLAVGAGLAILAAVPQVPPAPTTSLSDLRHLLERQALLSLAAATLGLGGMFTAFTYIALTLTRVTGYSSGAVPWLLMLFGGGLVAGNIVGGRLVDRALDATVIVALTGLLLVEVVFGLFASQQLVAAVALVLLGVFSFAATPGYQQRVVRSAGAAGAVASGATVAAVNLGNALGSLVGGLVISAGGGYTAPLWVGAGASGAALAVMTVATRSAGASQVSRGWSST